MRLQSRNSSAGSTRTERGGEFAFAGLVLHVGVEAELEHLDGDELLLLGGHHQVRELCRLGQHALQLVVPALRAQAVAQHAPVQSLHCPPRRKRDRVST
jgi:hypothetical protein